MLQVLNVLKTRKFWYELLIMTVGITIASAGIYYFLVPTKIVTGSVSGLSVFLSEILGRTGIEIKVSTLVLIINIGLIILALFTLGKDFGFKTIYTSLLMGPIMDVFEKVYPYERFFTFPGQTSIMGDPFIDMVCMVILLGLSQAMLFRINASTGGLDIIAKILNKYLHMEIGNSVAISGMVICATGLFISPFRLVVLGLITTWMNGLFIDYFTAGMNKKKRVCIICDEYEEIRDYIINSIHRGCSLYPMKGGYHEDDRVEIQALLTQGEFAKLMEYIRDHDFKAFITAGNVSEVYGYWIDKPHHWGGHKDLKGSEGDIEIDNTRAPEGNKSLDNDK